jgi:hypothetical protein
MTEIEKIIKFFIILYIIGSLLFILSVLYYLTGNLVTALIILLFPFLIVKIFDFRKRRRERLAKLIEELRSKLKEIEFPKETKPTIEPSIMDLLNLYFYNGNLKDILEIKSEAKKYLNIVIRYVDENSFLPKRSTNELMEKIQDYNTKRILERTFEFIHRYKDLLSEDKKTYTYNEYLTLKKFDIVIYNLDALWDFEINLRVLK